ncbi:MAG: hypothetical protein KA004_04130 [Verrucomicrobiales bacterium]|nr:hypothetical protein [Verrucomicrobiales bacterium]
MISPFVSLTAVAGLTLLPAAADPVLTVATPTTGTLNANYTTSKLFVDEIRGDSISMTVRFAPGDASLTEVEIVTNLNRRDFATADRNANGIEDAMESNQTEGIIGSDDSCYYRKYAMTPTDPPGMFVLVLPVQKTGAYRLTGRWKVAGDANWRWFTNGAANRRDHAITVSPAEARELVIYEINTLTMEAAGTGSAQRSTLQDLSDRPGALRTGAANRFNLAYLQALGVNTLWFQPWHPYGWENRHLSAADINARDPGAGATTWKWNAGAPGEDVNYGYRLGSPYAVKNFFEVEPRLTADFTGSVDSQADVSSAANRAKAMSALQNFVADADAAGIRVMPDAAFNHAAQDVELGPFGGQFLASTGNPGGGWASTDRIDSREVRFFSRSNDYWQRAGLGGGESPAPAPDRFDFNKWLDAKDIFFGRYAALWRNSGTAGAHQNEGDWFDFSSATYNGSSGGSFDGITQGAWKYFARYAPYWLEKTRPAAQNRNSSAADGDAAVRKAWDARGLDGIRCDFAQGVPPQAWEYIINVARSFKWNFVFMAESLDGGAVTYRSNRHFDILNENLLFAAKAPLQPGETLPGNLRNALETRRGAYGQGLLLLNTSSHDEQNYNDPWQALVRYAVFAAVDGVPMIFPGQELGLSDFYGYDLMEKNLGKYVPHFKTYNSLMPLWSNTDFGLDQLSPVYAAINRARNASAALRSASRYFLNQTSGSPHNELFAVAKYETANASPAWTDVVLAFVNTDRNAARSGTFNVSISQNGGSLLGIRSDRNYNVRNLSAYTAQDASRADAWLWPEGAAGRSGSAVLSGGIFVSIPRVPTASAGWTSAPYEAQYLKLFDVTPPPPPVPAHPAWGIAPHAVFTWDDRNAGPDDRITGYLADGTPLSLPTLTKTGTDGQTVSVTLRAVSAAGIHSSPVTTQMRLLSPAGDEDGDGQSNAAEHAAGTDALNPASALRIVSAFRSPGDSLTLSVSTVIGKRYTLQSSTNLTEWADEDDPGCVNLTADAVEASFTDQNPDGSRKFYRVLVLP